MVSFTYGGISMKKTFAVIGLDVFGLSLCKELSSLGAQVIAFDKDESAINKVSDFVTKGAAFDYTNEALLLEMGIKHVDNAIVSISGDIKDSILVTLMLKEIGIKNIVVEVENDYHEKVIKKLGVDQTISPSAAAGVRMAKRLMIDSIIDYYNVDDEYGLYELQIGHAFPDKELKDLDFRNAYNINIVIIKRGALVIIPKATDVLMHDDIVLVVGKHDSIKHFQSVISADE